MPTNRTRPSRKLVPPHSEPLALVSRVSQFVPLSGRTVGAATLPGNKQMVIAPGKNLVEVMIVAIRADV
jgi:hypothetical protein